MLQKLLDYVCQAVREKEIESTEYKRQCDERQAHFEELAGTLNEKQKEKLLALDLEYIMTEGQNKDDIFKSGLETGFKLAIQLIFNSL